MDSHGQKTSQKAAIQNEVHVTLLIYFDVIKKILTEKPEIDEAYREATLLMKSRHDLTQRIKARLNAEKGGDLRRLLGRSMLPKAGKRPKLGGRKRLLLPSFCSTPLSSSVNLTVLELVFGEAYRSYELPILLLLVIDGLVYDFAHYIFGHRNL